MVKQIEDNGEHQEYDQYFCPGGQKKSSQEKSHNKRARAAWYEQEKNFLYFFIVIHRRCSATIAARTASTGDVTGGWPQSAADIMQRILDSRD
jgi:hypothetical protein